MQDAESSRVEDQRFNWVCRSRTIELGARPLIMGILNVTPDSFSDGGLHSHTAAAVDHARAMVAAGADIIDIGGESTRPGAAAVPPDEELARVVPVVQALTRVIDVPVSVDTMKAKVAEAALSAGACIVNDVSALRHDPDMLPVVQEYGAGVVLMHMQGSPQTMQTCPTYGSVATEVSDFLHARAAALERQGLKRDSIVLDPGIGFGKTTEHNVELLRNIREIGKGVYPVLVGHSRKRFLGAITGRSVEDRLPGSLAALAWCVANGVEIMRVHDVEASHDAAAIVAALAGPPTWEAAPCRS